MGQPVGARLEEALSEHGRCTVKGREQLIGIRVSF